jgi:hypothetical protein
VLTGTLPNLLLIVAHAYLIFFNLRVASTSAGYAKPRSRKSQASRGEVTNTDETDLSFDDLPTYMTIC